MQKHVRLMPRGAGWTFRAWVPEEIGPIIGKKEIWKQFGAVSHREAVKLSNVASAEWHIAQAGHAMAHRIADPRGYRSARGGRRAVRLASARAARSRATRNQSDHIG